MPKRPLPQPDALGPGHEPSPRLIALRLLGRREYTAIELTRKLTDRGVEADEARAIVAALERENLVDDRRAAAAHVRTSHGVKGRGPRRIRLELEARGVDGTTAEEALRSIAPDDIQDSLRRLITRRVRSEPLSREERDRLFRQLIRKGFSTSDIERALKRP